MQVSRNPIETINLGKNGKKKKAIYLFPSQKEMDLATKLQFSMCFHLFSLATPFATWRVPKKVAEFERPTKIVVNLWSFGAIWRYNAIHTLRYITLRYVTFHCITFHCITLHYVALHYIALHYITLHYITLRYVTLRYVTLHYITLHICTYMEKDKMIVQQILPSFISCGLSCLP